MPAVPLMAVALVARYRPGPGATSARYPADGEWYVVAQADGSPLQARSLTHVVSAATEAQARQDLQDRQISPRNDPGGPRVGDDG